MTVWHKNLAALKQGSNAEVAALLQTMAESCLLAAELTPQGLVLRDGNGQLIGNIGGSAEVKLNPGVELVLIFGLGDGRLAQAVLQNASCRDVLIYEPDPVLLFTILHAIDLSELLASPKVRVITGTERDSWRLQLQPYFYEDYYRLSLVFSYQGLVTPNAEKIAGYAKWFADFIAYFQEYSQWEIQHGIKPNEEDAFWGLMNSLRNFPDYFAYPELQALKGLFTGTPGFVVSTGPSLSHSLNELNKIQGQAVIASCDSSLKLLSDKGIIPDFVATLERIGATKYFFADMPPLEATWLVGPAVVSPETFRAFRGPKLKVLRDVGFENWVTDTEVQSKFAMGSSASHLCYVILRHLGCSPIYLLGQDCAYDPFTGESHDQNVQKFIMEHGKWEKERDDSVEKFSAPGFAGRTQHTNKFWHGFAQQFAPLILPGSPPVYNVIPAEYGIPVPRTTHIEPQILFRNFSAPLVGKSSKLHAAIAAQVKGESADLIRNAVPRIKKIHDGLLVLSEAASNVLEEISHFRMSVDIAIPNRGHEAQYEGFFRKLEAYHRQILEFDNGFFDHFFLPLIASSHVLSGLHLAALLHLEKDPVRRAYQQIEQLYGWYRLIHFWAGRALHLLASCDREYWHMLND